MSRDEILDKLRDDEAYYGDFGKQFLSNSNIGDLLTNPEKYFKGENIADLPVFLIGGYFHTAILEPHKLDQFEIIDVATRNNAAYRKLGKHALLRKEVDNIDKMIASVDRIDEIRNLVRCETNEYEVPGLGELYGQQWKGKADILNHEQQLVIDLKTTGDIQKFRKSANMYNYDSQAWIYKQLFGYDVMFVAIDKTTHQIGMFPCSDSFYTEGEMKVEKAVQEYEKWHSEDFDREQSFIYELL